MVDISQKPLSSPTECLERLLQTEEYADLTIELPETEKNLKVHRMILAMWSPVFKAVLFGSMSEGNSIKLPEDHPEGFKWMLKYMYSGCTELPNVDLGLQVYMLSNKYQMEHLKTICSKYLKDSVTAVYIPQVMNVATLLEDDVLIDKCTEVLDTSADTVFSSPSVGSLSSNSLQQILKGRSQLKLRGEDITSKTIRKEIDQFLPQVRFLTMPTDEFVKNVLPEYILTIQELTKIQQIHANVQGIDIPEACSHSKIPRRRFEQSQLQSTMFSYNKQITSNVGRICCVGEERDYLSAIKCKCIIFLSKLVYDTNIGDTGKLLIRDSSRLDIGSADFNGIEACFQNPVILVPGQEYSFVPKGTSTDVGTHTYTIRDNNIPGRFVTDFTIHYWK